MEDRKIESMACGKIEKRSGSVVKCLTRDRGVVGSSLTRGTALSP